jgi:hypothetical protein
MSELILGFRTLVHLEGASGRRGCREGMLDAALA